MNDKILNKLKTITTSPGVYLMKDITNKIIYVGKAKNLKNRVSSYFNNTEKQIKVSAMVQNIEDFDYIICQSEYDALALESNLIKKYMPYYNILLKDGKAYPYIKIDLNADFPILEVARKVDNGGNCKYFGPFIGKYRAYDLIKISISAFGLRECKKKIVQGKVERPCIRFEMGLCEAPCNAKISKIEYAKKVKEAIKFLSGDDALILKRLNEKMQKCIESENYERAIIYRDYIQKVKAIDNQIVAQLTKSTNFDIFAISDDGNKCSIAVGIVRNGKMLGVESSTISGIDEDSLQSYILQYYKDNLMAKEIILEQDISDDTKKLLQSTVPFKITFTVPKRGIKKSLLNVVHKNAYQHFIKTSDKETLNYERTVGAIKNLQKALNLKKLPRRIECYDISHISGVYKVASMVVFIDGSPAKKMYRKFKIKEVEGNNDFASLQEVIKRRLLELRSEEKNDESFKSVPDLMIIDGGKGQLSSVMEIFENYAGEYKNQIEVVSLAKRIEEVFVPNNSVSIILGKDKQELKLIQRVRDEAHRFAITFHRQLRGKGMVSSELDEIKGIGKVKRKEILKHFTSFEKLKNATLNEIMEVKGISEKDALAIYNKFHS
ncbi:MAG: excinuclease ABC subunit UvrC [Christensenellales bacterium]